MANRKSQVEKFNKKWGKEEQDLHAIKQAEIKRQQEAPTSMEETEEVKAMRVWAKIWDNSIERSIADKVQPIVRSMAKDVVQELTPTIREIVREELTYMVKGLLQASATTTTNSMVASAVEDLQGKIEEVEEPTVQEEYVPSTVEDAILLAYDKGYDPYKGTVYTRLLKGKYSTLYQNYKKKNKGKGTWKELVHVVLTEKKGVNV